MKTTRWHCPLCQREGLLPNDTGNPVRIILRDPHTAAWKEVSWDPSMGCPSYACQSPSVDLVEFTPLYPGLDSTSVLPPPPPDGFDMLRDHFISPPPLPLAATPDTWQWI
jgi:hypothetical protein